MRHSINYKAMCGGGFIKHAVDSVMQQRRERKDRHDLHELQYGEEKGKIHKITHVDFSHLDPEEVLRVRQRIQEKHKRKLRRYYLLLILIFGLLCVPFIYFRLIHR